MRVLFTGAGGAGTQALWELMSNRYDVHFCDADPRRISPVVPDSHAHAVPMGADPSFLDAVVRLSGDIGIDVLVPGVDEELETLARHRADLEPTAVLLPTVEFVGTMLDKFDFVDFLVRAGIPVPRTALLGDSDGWDRFPAIVKPRRGRGSRGISVAADARALDGIRYRHAIDADAYVVQELIRGDEYSVQVMVNGSGALRAVYPAHVLAKRGITISAIGTPHPGVLALCKQIHAASPTPGCYNVQGIVDEHGAFIPFEVNPRVSTTLCLAVAAGLDPIALCFDDVTCAPLADFEADVRLERFWSNEIVRPSDDDRGRQR